jgi:hypothetical protein
MDGEEDGEGDEPSSPAVMRQRPPLTTRERRHAVEIGLLPIPLAGLLLTPFAILGAASPGDVVAAALVYGGLLGLAAGFVYVDRVHARQCPRCGDRDERGVAACSRCGYDLQARPRYACAEGHAVRLDPGLCDCGRRLHRLPTVRGVGREIALMLRIGAWLLAFLLGIGLLLQVLDRAG